MKPPQYVTPDLANFVRDSLKIHDHRAH
jgi:hypothetical protein